MSKARTKAKSIDKLNNQLNSLGKRCTKLAILESRFEDKKDLKELELCQKLEKVLEKHFDNYSYIVGDYFDCREFKIPELIKFHLSKSYTVLASLYNELSNIKDEITNKAISNIEIDSKEEGDSLQLGQFEQSGDLFLDLSQESFFNNNVEVTSYNSGKYYSIEDALVYSLSNKGKVNIDYIAEISGKDKQYVIDGLTASNSIFLDPSVNHNGVYETFVTYDDYLSGNLREKFEIAKKAFETDSRFRRNVEVLESNMSDTIDAKYIYITLGSPWIPADIIDSFIGDNIGFPLDKIEGETYDYKTKFDPQTVTWSIPYKNFYSRYNNAVRHVFGTKDINGVEILEKMLNRKDCVIKKSELDEKTRKRKVVVDSKATLEISEKQKLLNDTFLKWVWKDEKRKARLEKIYNDTYACLHTRKYNGSFLKFPTMSDNVKLYDYQKNAIARIIFSPNTLLAHEVGSGKTLEMIAASMEQRRMGLSQKNLIVVPNNLIGQWKEEFYKAYPNANLLCLEGSVFYRGSRNEYLRMIRDNDYDAIIMTYSCFDLIPANKKELLEEISKLAHEIENWISKTFSLDCLSELKHSVGENSPFKSEIKSTERPLQNSKILRDVQKIINKVTKFFKIHGVSIFFEELGVNRLFIDEAQNYKNITIDTKMNHVLGVTKEGAAKADNLLKIVRIVQKENNGGGVVFATGTPISNSVSDAYVMQNYLQPSLLSFMNINNFDAWTGVFAEYVNEFEIDVDTDGFKIATRFSKFHNLQELTSMLSMFADFHRVEKAPNIPQQVNYIDNQIKLSPEMGQYLKEITQRADLVHSRRVPPNIDNMLKITHDGRAAALDLRLVKYSAQRTGESKVNKCADNILKVYKKTNDFLGTQLVFCDISTPKDSFNIYDELKQILVSKGIPKKEIDYVHNYSNEVERSKLFENVRNGKIRILIGSTIKLGIGVNVQHRLKAIHHLDIPWRPADMTQREGRILRQGNTNSEVEIYRYITKGTFDAYSWQLLETKQKFIYDLLSGSLEERSKEDIENTVLSYGEVKALATGNELIKKRIDVQNKFNQIATLKRNQDILFNQLEIELASLPREIEKLEQHCANIRSDITTYHANRIDHSKEVRANLRKNFNRLLMNNRMVPKETFIMKYQGFDMVLPSYMDIEKPFVWLKGNVNHCIKLSGKELGDLVRIDNFLSELSDLRDDCDKKIMEKTKKIESIKEILSSPKDYSMMLETYAKEIENIDVELNNLKEERIQEQKKQHSENLRSK